MNTYFVYGQTNSDYASGMLTKPQDRKPIVTKLCDQFGLLIKEFLYTKADNFNFIMVVESESGESVEAALNVAMASGTWNSLNWSRAFNSIEHKEIYEKSKVGMASYVTTMQVAEKKE